ncbi:unnamed protein product [Arabidopsis thaliana]|uniref:Uncharacterized protein n=1 Tax=Arabidopsis thaliana TaxID=3702 RepID=A0A5S9XQC2_ARATH|nr:unnamed protein product [Arabidopsis thaliana]
MFIIQLMNMTYALNVNWKRRTTVSLSIPATVRPGGSWFIIRNPLHLFGEAILIKIKGSCDGGQFHKTPKVRALPVELRCGVEEGDFTARNERERWLDSECGDAGDFTGLLVPGGGRLWSGEAMPPSMDS